MAKIILSIGDTVLQEIALAKERITIGRRPHNDIVIDNLAISGEHAVIVTHNDDSFLEDLNSTNGTQVNGQPVKKHFLQDGDVVELAQFRVTYIASNKSDVHKHLTGVATQSGLTSQFLPTIRVLNGPSAGKEISLIRVLTTLGHPNGQIALVIRRDQSYFLAHVEGDRYPVLNGNTIGAAPHQLFNGDVIELSGAQMKIFLP